MNGVGEDRIQEVVIGGSHEGERVFAGQGVSRCDEIAD